ncbi:MAG: hypothetical protein H0U70_03410 [Tatlockia sp.]|nr:hypothetical protein [Tatlockia sp.]
MLKNTFFLTLFFLSHSAQALESSAFYQIDLIVFAHQPALNPGLSLNSTLANLKTSIPLLTEVSKDLSPYHLLPSSSSQLRESYWALHRNPQYQVLLHYSWLQPLNSQSALNLPKIELKGWELEGTLRVQRSNYYLLDSEFSVSTPNNKETPFVFSQKQRLKGGNTYYLDHPIAGLLIKIHQLNNT